MKTLILKKHLNFKRRISKKMFRLFKNVYQFLFIKKQEKKKILFIIGCQRSGTTLLTEIFENDIKVKVYGESSKLSSIDKYKLKLDSLILVKREIDKNNVRNIVCKPLVETQNIEKLLNYFNDSKGLWVYRDYKDVASSNLNKFGIRNGINNLRAVINKESNNWRSELVSLNTLNVVRKYYSEDMIPHDAAALFWYVRNVLFFELNLQENKRIRMCKYNDFVIDPLRHMKDIYSFTKFEFNNENITSKAKVHSLSIGKGQKVMLSHEINALCENLMNRLDAVYKKQNSLREFSDNLKLEDSLYKEHSYC